MTFSLLKLPLEILYLSEIQIILSWYVNSDFDFRLLCREIRGSS